MAIDGVRDAPDVRRQRTLRVMVWSRRPPPLNTLVRHLSGLMIDSAATADCARSGGSSHIYVGNLETVPNGTTVMS